ncbi:FAD-binding oxidoreductase [Streptacidiphilus sp. EB103A]|uniref:FAD-binding oxidoreductase n=1 Tax=Streptacidiphilus sp. EB103A TaxID=3156275 RepID=UPI0035187F63
MSADDCLRTESAGIWNAMHKGVPAVVVQPRGPEEAARAVLAARRRGLAVVVRGGGHSVSGESVGHGALLLDLSRLRAVEVSAGHVRVGGGALWSDLDAAAWQAGGAVPGGAVSHTGVAGLALGGGFGWLSRAYGLSCDHLVRAEVVTAAGRLLSVDAVTDPEVLWALRGGGRGLGVVTSLTFALRAMPPTVWGGQSQYDAQLASVLLARLVDQGAAMPRAVSVIWGMGRPPSGESTPFAGLAVCALDGTGRQAVEGLLDGLPPRVNGMQSRAYPDLQRMADALWPHGRRYYFTSGFLGPLDSSAQEALLDIGMSMPPDSQLQLHLLGGRVSDRQAEAGAFGPVAAPYLLTVAARWNTPDLDRERSRWVRSVSARTRPWAHRGAYANLSSDAAASTPPARAGSRWQAVKHRLDPDRLFA